MPCVFTVRVDDMFTTASLTVAATSAIAESVLERSSIASLEIVGSAE